MVGTEGVDFILGTVTCALVQTPLCKPPETCSSSLVSVSDGGVHSRYDQVVATIQGAAERGCKRIRMHVLTDGRDVPGEKHREKHNECNCCSHLGAVVIDRGEGEGEQMGAASSLSGSWKRIWRACKVRVATQRSLRGGGACASAWTDMRSAKGRMTSAEADMRSRCCIPTVIHPSGCIPHCRGGVARWLHK